MMEFKAHLFTTRQKASGDYGPLLDGIRDAFAHEKKGVGQIKKSIQRIFKGEVVVDEFGQKVDFSTFKKIYPAIVAYDDDVNFHKFRKFIADAFLSHSTPLEDPESRVGPVLFFTTRDIELLEQCSHEEEVAKVLKRYIEYVEKHPDDEFGNFSIFIHKTTDYKKDQFYIRREHNRLFEQLREEFLKRYKEYYAAKGITEPEGDPGIGQTGSNPSPSP